VDGCARAVEIMTPRAGRVRSARAAWARVPSGSRSRAQCGSEFRVLCARAAAPPISGRATTRGATRSHVFYGSSRLGCFAARERLRRTRRGRRVGARAGESEEPGAGVSELSNMRSRIRDDLKRTHF